VNILFIHPVNIDYPGGAERFIAEVSKRLVSRGHNVGVLYVDWAPHRFISAQNSYELLSHDVKLYRCSYVKLPRGFPILDPHCIAKLSKENDILYMSAYPLTKSLCIY